MHAWSKGFLQVILRGAYFSLPASSSFVGSTANLYCIELELGFYPLSSVGSGYHEEEINADLYGG